MAKGMFNVKFDISQVGKLCDRLKKELKSVKGARAGYFKYHAYPSEEGKKPLTVLRNALIQEYGCKITVTDKMRAWFRHQGYPLKEDTTEIKIPERPFIRPAKSKNEAKWVKYVKENFDANGDGTMTLEKIAENVGLMMEDAIITSLEKVTEPAKSKMAEELEGEGHNHPLIGKHGLLKQEVHHEVIKKKR